MSEWVREIDREREKDSEKRGRREIHKVRTPAMKLLGREESVWWKEKLKEREGEWTKKRKSECERERERERKEKREREKKKDR